MGGEILEGVSIAQYQGRQALFQTQGDPRGWVFQGFLGALLCALPWWGSILLTFLPEARVKEPTRAGFFVSGAETCGE
jgi:hypothetical protein